jgi:hypothetical protein
VRKVLACSNLDGDTEAGRVVDKLAPEVVMARLMRGTASSMRTSSFLMSWTIRRVSSSCAARDVDLVLFRLDDSSAAAAFERRSPRDWISHRRALVRVTADSRVVLPLAEL